MASQSSKYPLCVGERQRGRDLPGVAVESEAPGQVRSRYQVAALSAEPRESGRVVRERRGSHVGVGAVDGDVVRSLLVGCCGADCFSTLHVPVQQPTHGLAVRPIGVGLVGLVGGVGVQQVVDLEAVPLQLRHQVCAGQVVEEPAGGAWWNTGESCCRSDGEL